MFLYNVQSYLKTHWSNSDRLCCFKSTVRKLQFKRSGSHIFMLDFKDFSTISELLCSQTKHIIYLIMKIHDSFLLSASTANQTPSNSYPNALSPNYCLKDKYLENCLLCAQTSVVLVYSLPHFLTIKKMSKTDTGGILSLSLYNFSRPRKLLGKNNKAFFFTWRTSEKDIFLVSLWQGAVRWVPPGGLPSEYRGHAWRANVPFVQTAAQLLLSAAAIPLLTLPRQTASIKSYPHFLAHWIRARGWVVPTNLQLLLPLHPKAGKGGGVERCSYK